MPNSAVHVSTRNHAVSIARAEKALLVVADAKDGKPEVLRVACRWTSSTRGRYHASGRECLHARRVAKPCGVRRRTMMTAQIEDIIGDYRAFNWVPQWLMTATGPNPLPR